MKKKRILGIIFIILGLIFVVLFVVLSKEFLWKDNNVIDNSLKDTLSLKINALTSDYHCNINRKMDNEKSCIYFNDLTNDKEFSDSYKLYYLILSNMNNATKVDYDKDLEEDYSFGDYVGTHYISADFIKDQFKKIYGTDKQLDMKIVNDVDKMPKINYNQKTNNNYIANSFKDDKDAYVITKNLKYEKDADKIYVYTAVVYISKVYKEEDSYIVYSNYDSDKVVKLITLNDVKNYDISEKSKEYTLYKHTFKKNADNEYIFDSVEKGAM